MPAQESRLSYHPGSLDHPMQCRFTLQELAVAFPSQILTNDDLEQHHPDWNIAELSRRVGVRSRHIAAKDQTALDLGEEACRQLLADNPTLPQRIDALIFCTQSPDFIVPGNACILHGRLGLPDHVAAFDIGQACSGYIYSLCVAGSMIHSGASRNIIVVNADTYSKYIHPQDRSARLLFGDGAAATWVSSGEKASGISACKFGTGGSSYDKFIIPAGGCRTPRSAKTQVEHVDTSGNVRTPEHIHMSGRDIFHFVCSTIPPHISEVLAEACLTVDDIDLFIFHQASAAVLDSIANLADIPSAKVFRNLQEKGNTVSASIPIALHDAQSRGLASKGDKLFLCGFGAGLSWASMVLEL